MVNLIRHANNAIVEVLRTGSEMLREVEKGFRNTLSLRRDRKLRDFSLLVSLRKLPVLGVGEVSILINRFNNRF